MGKADLHLHTTASDGMMSPAMLLNYVSVHTRLDLIAITDHNTLEGYYRAREFHDRRENDHLHGIELIPGIEVSSRDGHILGINVTRVIPRGLSAAETVTAIHEAGGLALAVAKVLRAEPGGIAGLVKRQTARTGHRMTAGQPALKGSC